MSIYADLIEKIENNRNTEERIQAINELAEIGDETLFDLLIEQTSSSIHRIRFASAGAIDSIRKRTGEDFTRVGLALCDSQGKYSTLLFEKALSHENFMFRMSAIKAVIPLKEPDSVPVIRDFLKNEPNCFVRSLGVKAIARIAKEAGIDSLVYFLNDKSPRVRANTIEALALCSESYRDFIKAMIKDTDYRVKSTAACYLHPNGKENILTHLTAMAKGDYAHKSAGLWALEQIKDPAYNEALRIIALADTNLKSRAEILLKNLGGRQEAADSQKSKSMSKSYTVDKNEAERAISKKGSTFMFFVKIILSLALLVGVAFGGLITYERYTLEGDYKKAKQAMTEKNYDNARVKFETLGNYKDSALLLKQVLKNSRIDKAQKAYEAGKYQDALDLYRALVMDHIDTEKSKKGEYNSFRALIEKNIKQARFDDASTWVDKALVTFPDDTFFVKRKENILIEKGLELEKQGLVTRAIDYFEDLKKKYPAYDTALIQDRLYIKLADSLERAGQPDKALEILLKQTESTFISKEDLKKSIVTNYCLLITQMLEKGQSEEALALSERAYSEYPGEKLESVKIEAMKAEIDRLSAVRQFDRAARILHLALKIRPDDPGLKELDSRMKTLTAGSGSVDSIKSYRQSIKVLTAKYNIEKTPAIWAALADAAVELSEKLLHKPAIEEATVELKRVLQILPGDKKIQAQLSKLYFLRGEEKYILDDFRQAERYFGLSLEYHKNKEAQQGLEKCRIKDIYDLYLQGDYKSALPGFRDILAKSPGHEKAKKGLAMCLIELADRQIRVNQPKKALEMLRQAWDLKKDLPRLSDYYLDAGLALFQKHSAQTDFENARKIIEELRLKFPDSQRVKTAVTSLYIREAEVKKAEQLKQLAAEQEKQQRLEIARQLMQQQETQAREEMVKQMQYRQKVIFECTDPGNDDSGPGSYTYPDNDDFDKGDLDIREVRIINSGAYIDCIITFQNQIETRVSSSSASDTGQAGSRQGDRNAACWRVGENGWIYQLIDIYIDIDKTPGSGEVWALPGRNVKFSPNDAWDKVILITPRSQPVVKSFINQKVNNSTLHSMKDKIIVPKSYTLQGATLTARIPASDLGPIDLDWSFQVFSLCYAEQDSPDLLLNLAVESARSDCTFGGGSSFEGNPNVLDIIMPAGQSQYSVLSRYQARPDKNQNVYPVVPMVNWNTRTR